MLKIKNILVILIIGILLNSCVGDAIGTINIANKGLGEENNLDTRVYDHENNIANLNKDVDALIEDYKNGTR